MAEQCSLVHLVNSLPPRTDGTELRGELHVEMVTGGRGTLCPGEWRCPQMGLSEPQEVLQSDIIATKGKEGEMEHE